MTNAQQNAVLARRIRVHTKRSARSRETAMQALIRKGFFKPDGSPVPEFAAETADA